MKVFQGTVSRLFLALAILASTLAIACASGTGGTIPNESVQLRQIRNVEAKFDRILDVAIRTQLAGGRAAIVADEMATNNETGEVDESGRQLVFRQRLHRLQRLTGTELTTLDLQRLRTALHLRVDEAYAAQSDLSRFSDLTSLSVGADAITGSLNAPTQGLGR